MNGDPWLEMFNASHLILSAARRHLYSDPSHSLWSALGRLEPSLSPEAGCAQRMCFARMVLAELHALPFRPGPGASSDGSRRGEARIGTLTEEAQRCFEILGSLEASRKATPWELYSQALVLHIGIRAAGNQERAVTVPEEELVERLFSLGSRLLEEIPRGDVILRWQALTLLSRHVADRLYRDEIGRAPAVVLELGQRLAAAESGTFNDRGLRLALARHQASSQEH